MRRWQKTKTPLIALVFFVFIAFSILYNESKIQVIQEPPTQSESNVIRERPTSFAETGSLLDSPPTQHLNLTNKSPVRLDKFTTCITTVSYTGRNHGFTLPRGEFTDRRAAMDDVKDCDLFSGKWVFDNTSYPLYHESDCPYMSDQLACHKHGRSDLGYQLQRWQPNNCNLKRFDAVEMWEKLRGKRLMFVGDSLNRGQWISMLCLLHSSVPRDQQTITPNSKLTIFRAENYNATVEFLWAPLLVESNCDDPVDHRLSERIIKPDAILNHSVIWEQADILVFNSYLWWRQGLVKLLWSNQVNGVCEEIDGREAMELAMESWANWVDSNIDPAKKKVFFVSMSPTHQMKDEWEPGSEGGNCYNETEPINDAKYWGSSSDLPTMRMIDNILNKLGSKVSLINITQLSEYRKDGHPSIFRKFWEQLSSENLANPSSYSDCIHWCLPGVPDIWNELLFQVL